MAEATRSLPVKDGIRRHRRSMAAGLGLCAVTVVGALMIPVGLPDATEQDVRSRLAGETVIVSPAEDLSAFASTKRWGGLTFEELEARRRAAETGSNADAARRDRMGFVGTSATPHDQVVLITLPGGEVRRVPAGGTLPDGRVVSDVTYTTATLSDTATGDEELELFPSPPAETDGTGVDSAGAASQNR